MPLCVDWLDWVSMGQLERSHHRLRRRQLGLDDGVAIVGAHRHRAAGRLESVADVAQREVTVVTAADYHSKVFVVCREYDEDGVPEVAGCLGDAEVGRRFSPRVEAATSGGILDYQPLGIRRPGDVFLSWR